jgi:hypothetical protein
MSRQTPNTPPPAAPAKEPRGPFGKSQIRLFNYIMLHPGCTLTEIREDEFPDKNGNYIWNLVRENVAYLKKDEIGTGIPDKWYIRINKLAEVIDIKALIKTGKYIRAKPMEQQAMTFPEQPNT